MNSTAARLGCVIALLALSLLTIEAAWQGLAAAWTVRGESAKDAWERTPGQMTLWTEARDYLATSARLDNGSALWRESLGTLLVERTQHPGLDYRQRIQLWRTSLDMFRADVRRRPVWPYAWGQIVALKYMLGEIDEEFAKALRRTSELGPAEPSLQRTVVQFGFLAWFRLGAGERDAVAGMLRRGLEMDRGGMISTIRQVWGARVVCSSAEFQRLLPEFSCGS